MYPFSRPHHWYNKPVDVLAGACAGMLGGFVATWAMSKFEEATKPGNSAHSHNGAHPARISEERLKERQEEIEQTQKAAQESTVKTAEAISRKVFNHELSETEKELAGPVVHYTYGTLAGGLYGALSELWPLTDAGFGMGYGVAMWLLGSEAAVPALRLGPPPTKASPTQHADNLAGHLVYGITLDVARRVAREIL